MAAAASRIGAIGKKVAPLLAGKLGSIEKANLIVRASRTAYIGTASSIILIWYSAWRNERIPPEKSFFPFPGVGKWPARFRPDRPNTDSDMGYQPKGGTALISAGGGNTLPGGFSMGGAAGEVISSSGPAGPPHWGGAKAVADALAANTGLASTSRKRSTQSTSSGGVSDHWEGCRECYAIDLSGSIPHMDRAAAVIMRQLGAHYTGGELVHTVERNGFRIQILYRTMVGGNHYDHIHIGVRKVGYAP